MDGAQCNAAAGGAGGSVIGGTGGGLAPTSTGGTPAPSFDAGMPRPQGNTLQVSLERMADAGIAAQCPGDCADVEAVVHGGHPPYRFEWEDGSKKAKRHVCLDASATLRVTVTDTAVSDDEFVAHVAETASAELGIEVHDCEMPAKDAGTPHEGDPCHEHAAPETGDAGSFDPIVKWTWKGGGSLVTPLVANLTDDNDDGKIDLGDTPDVVLVDNLSTDTVISSIVVIDGATGEEHFRIPDARTESTPALGDIDGDGVVDIVFPANDLSLRAFDHAGNPIWATPADALPSTYGITISLADLDHDGSPEIIAGELVFDAKGNMLWTASQTDVPDFTSPTAADLDDDGYLEVVWGQLAYRHDGTEYYHSTDPLFQSGSMGHYVAIADFDADQKPEIVVVTPNDLLVLDNQGNTLNMVDRSGGNSYPFPPAIADLDGDGRPEILVSNGMKFTAYDGELKEVWSMPVVDMSGIAAGTAFDFLGDGTAEAMYCDETTSWGFDGASGAVVFMQPRYSGTLIEYPSVADVDNDGSADFLIVSNNTNGATDDYGLRLISDRDARWVPARRILNQETYHVTNVNEDGTIPVNEMPSWKLNNSFRAQAQIADDGVVCLPPKPGLL